MNRPSRILIHMANAKLWAMRSVCKRLHVGAVITDGSMRQVLSVGYNGPAKGLSHDRCKEKVVGGCGCMHAEDNAIAQLNSPVERKLIFVTNVPCSMCAQRIIQARVKGVWYLDEYRSEEGLCLLKEGGLHVEQVDGEELSLLFSKADT